MPTVDVNSAQNKMYTNYAKGSETLKAEGLAILKIIVKKDGTVRASKPKVTADPITGKAAYIWRMVVFIVSPKPGHSCMPCTCDWDLPVTDENGKWRYSLAAAMAKTLKPIEDAIIDSIDKSEWHGVHTWGKILGNPSI
jgi:hypothetical protein